MRKYSLMIQVRCMPNANLVAIIAQRINMLITVTSYMNEIVYQIINVFMSYKETQMSSYMYIPNCYGLLFTGVADTEA